MKIKLLKEKGGCSFSTFGRKVGEVVEAREGSISGILLVEWKDKPEYSFSVYPGEWVPMNFPHLNMEED